METKRISNPTRFGKRTHGITVAWTVCAIAALLGTSAAADTASTKKHSTHPATKASSSSSSHGKITHGRGKKYKRTRGQQKIDGERARQIQEALVREHYLSGDASGNWNQSSEDAMRRFQADHGWQTKTVPDSRALIALGLGPNQDHLLNPESAMTSSAPVKSAAVGSGPANTHKH